jgi:hypothetical protein
MKVYNFVALQEAKYSSRIAISSKRDSSAMKAIAVLTMIFLPGTFVAVSLPASAETPQSLILTDFLCHAYTGFFHRCPTSVY